MDVDLRPGADFYKVIARLRGAEPKIKKELSKAVRSASKPIVTKMRQNVKGIESRGRAGGGTNQRVTNRDFGVSGYRSKLANRKGAGLRESIAKGVQTKISYSGNRTGVRIRVDGKYLPVDQRPLIKATNKGEVRHPLFGNRSVWVTQQFTPPLWFDGPARTMGPAALEQIKRAAVKALKELDG